MCVTDRNSIIIIIAVQTNAERTIEGLNYLYNINLIRRAHGSYVTIHDTYKKGRYLCDRAHAADRTLTHHTQKRDTVHTFVKRNR